ncbi:hypothetical protein FHX37_4494 [Haloactinospora alba]|uniref:Uncharacterized protein n=1 Tax=Haloactinospora alba TaxID=405555 RepID=A0A543N7F6_9ACTN|nr:hypothetical protein [Haloactinospora alba]TQN27765.1 hypothetical protein FHX37_4494 [Haloactinospora alba]
MTTLTPEAAEPATTALFDTMVPLTLAADRRINPGRWVLSPKFAAADVTVFEDRSHAIEWMNAHAGTVRGCVRIAYETSRYETAWTLCEGLWGWLHISKDWWLWRTTHEVGVEAAQQCDIEAQARMLSALGQCTCGRTTLMRPNACTNVPAHFGSPLSTPSDKQHPRKS